MVAYIEAFERAIVPPHNLNFPLVGSTGHTFVASALCLGQLFAVQSDDHLVRTQHNTPRSYVACDFRNCGECDTPRALNKRK